jgi:hypothetical protein
MGKRPFVQFLACSPPYCMANYAKLLELVATTLPEAGLNVNLREDTPGLGGMAWLAQLYYSM